MPPTIISPRKGLPTLRASMRTLPSMAQNMISLVKRPRKQLPAQVTWPFRRSRWFCDERESALLVLNFRVKKPSVFVQIFVRDEAEFRDRAVGERTVEGPVVAADVVVAAFGVLEAFVEVETGYLRTFESLFAVEGG